MCSVHRRAQSLARTHRQPPATTRLYSTPYYDHRLLCTLPVIPPHLGHSASPQNHDRHGLSSKTTPILNKVKTKRMCSQPLRCREDGREQLHSLHPFNHPTRTVPAKSFITQTYWHIPQVPAFSYSLWIHDFDAVPSDTTYTLFLAESSWWPPCRDAEVVFVQ